MNLIRALPLTLLIFLAGCTSFFPSKGSFSADVQQTKVVTEYVATDVPSQFLDCDRLKVHVPKGTLSNEQVGGVIIQQNSIINECQSDVRSARKYQAQNKKNLSKASKATR